MKKFISLLFSLFCCVSLRADIINGDTDPVGAPRDLSINKLFAGYDYGHLLTTTVRNHILTHVSGDNLRTFTAASRLVLHNTTLELDGTYTVTHGSIDVVGDVQILGSGNKFRLENAALFIASGSSLTIGDGVNFEFAPTSSWARTVFFEDASSELVLEDSTLTVSNGLGMRLTYGNVRVKGTSTITNVRTDYSRTVTSQALFLGVGLVEEDDCKLIIESGARLKVGNGGIIYRNAGTGSLDDSNGEGTLEVLDGGNFLFQESSNFGNLGLTIDDGTMSGLEGEDNIYTLVESVLTTTGTGDPTINHIRSVAWSPDGQYVAANYSARLAVFRFDGSNLIPVTEVDTGVTSASRAVIWSHDGKYIIQGASGATIAKVYYFYGKSQLIPTASTSLTNMYNPSLSPDGLFLSFDNAVNYYIYRFLGNSFRLVTPAFPPVGSVTRSARATTWLSSGRQLAGLANGVVETLFLYNFDGIANFSSVQNITNFGTSGAARALWGRGALGIFSGYGSGAEVNVVKYDGKTLTRLQSLTWPASTYLIDLAWSPEGKSALLSQASAGDSLDAVGFNPGGTIFHVNTDQGSSSILLGSDVSGVDWHPSKNLAIVGRSGNAFVDEGLTTSHHIRVYNVKGTKTGLSTNLSNVTLNIDKDTTIKDLNLNLG